MVLKNILGVQGCSLLTSRRFNAGICQIRIGFRGALWCNSVGTKRLWRKPYGIRTRGRVCKFTSSGSIRASSTITLMGIVHARYCFSSNPFPLILNAPPPPLPNIKIGFRGFHFNIRGVSGACGHDWPLSLKSLNYSREP